MAKRMEGFVGRVWWVDLSAEHSVHVVLGREKFS